MHCSSFIGQIAQIKMDYFEKWDISEHSVSSNNLSLVIAERLQVLISQNRFRFFIMIEEQLLSVLVNKICNYNILIYLLFLFTL